MEQSTETTPAVGQRELALDACCAVLVAIESAMESLGVGDGQADPESVQQALRRAISSLHQAIEALHLPGGPDVNGDGVGVVFDGSNPNLGAYRSGPTGDSDEPRTLPRGPEWAG